VQEVEPTRPRALNPRLDRDLETICLKCLRKEPHSRYGSAEALADDLTRWLAGEPIRARPAGVGERLRKWALRRPAVAALAGSLAAMTLSALLLVSWHWYGAITARREADEQRRRAERWVIHYSLESALNLLEKGQTPRGMLWLTNTLERVNEAGFTPKETEELRRPILANLGAWYGRLCQLRSLLPHSNSLQTAAFSPDGQRVVTLEVSGRLRVWETTGRLCSEWFVQRGVPILAAGFSPHARLLATAGSDETVYLWDTETGENIRTLRAPANERIGPIRAVAVSSGGWVAAGGDEAIIGIWDISGNKWSYSLKGHKYGILTLAFSPRGAVLASGSEDRTVRLWDVPGQKEVRTCKGPRMDGCSHHYAVRAVAFSPDGTKLVSGSEDYTAQIWNVEDGKPMLWNEDAPLVLAHQDAVQAVAFSAEGKRVLTGSFDRTAQLWDAATGRALDPPLEHPGGVGTVAFGLDGRFLTAARDGTVRVWSSTEEQAWLHRFTPNDSVMAVALSPDGRLALTGSGRSACLWSTETGQCLGPLEGRGREAGSGHQDDVWAVAFSPDGRSILTTSRDGTVRVWDTESRQPRCDELHRPIVLELAHRGRSAVFTPDGRQILTGAGNSVGEDVRGAACLWDIGRGQPRGQPLQQREIVWQVAVSPDARTAAIAAGDDSTQLWDLQRLQPFGSSLSHQNRVVALDFSPDGSLLATGSTDKMARLWDAATGAPSGHPFEHGGAVWGVAFADARTLVTGCRDGRVRLWDLPTRSLIGPPWSHQGIVWSVACHSPSRTILTGGEDKTACLWRLPPPWENDVQHARLRVEVSTGLVLDANGVVRWLDPSSWEQRRQALQGPSGTSLSPASMTKDP
jgi:WD40 repeat protein